MVLWKLEENALLGYGKYLHLNRKFGDIYSVSFLQDLCKAHAQYLWLKIIFVKLRLQVSLYVGASCQNMIAYGICFKRCHILQNEELWIHVTEQEDEQSKKNFLQL